MNRRIQKRFLLILLLRCFSCDAGGFFWHISDHHLDPYYNQDATDPTKVCPSSYNNTVENAGRWGNYRCDSPWVLVKSSVDAMKKIKSVPDFIVWTGDDTLHTGEEDKYLGKEKVLEIVCNITTLLKNVFPETKFYPAMGNHDYHPKSQIPPGKSEIQSAIANFWKDWMTQEAYESFNNNGYYTEVIKESKHRLISLNSNLWYTSNKNVNGKDDPGDQFQWLEDRLEVARTSFEKVYIIGHVPPGYFELVDYKYWYYRDYNERYNSIVRSYADVIAGQFFGHHHTDTFRLFKDENGHTVSSLLITPGVTPWRTTLPGVVDGANNPGIRLYEYNKETLNIEDYTQYYVNLTAANEQKDTQDMEWAVEYKAKSTYNIQDLSTISLTELANKMRFGCDKKNPECPEEFETYAFYNSVSYNTKPCNATCQRDQLCAIMEVEYEDHRKCIENWGSSGFLLHGKPFYIFLMSVFHHLLQSVV